MSEKKHCDPASIRKIRVQVPATSANLGTGFDALGMALDLANCFTFVIERTNSPGHGKGTAAKEVSLPLRSFHAVFEKVAEQSPRVSVFSDNGVPSSRGLGSSSTCVIGGILAANHYLDNPLTQDEILDLATAIEGHPDNVAPALLGGVIASVTTEQGVVWDRLAISGDWQMIALIPDFKLSTRDARRVLPQTVAYRDAVHNGSRSALLISALVNGRKDLMRVALDDRLHQPYRKTLIPDYDPLMRTLAQRGAWGAFLSGAGPTILAFVERTEDFKGFLSDLDLNAKWRILPLKIVRQGAQIIAGTGCR